MKGAGCVKSLTWRLANSFHTHPFIHEIMVIGACLVPVLQVLTLYEALTSKHCFQGTTAVILVAYGLWHKCCVISAPGVQGKGDCHLLWEWSHRRQIFVTWLVGTARTELVRCCFFPKFQMGLGQPGMTSLYGDSWTHSLSCGPGRVPASGPVWARGPGQQLSKSWFCTDRHDCLPLYQNPSHRGKKAKYRVWGTGKEALWVGAQPQAFRAVCRIAQLNAQRG